VNVLGAAATVTSIGAIAALDDETFLQDVHERLERRRNLVHEVFKDNPCINVQKSESGFLTWIDVSRLGTSSEVVSYILEHAKILVNEGSPYGKQGEGYIRIVTGCFMDDERATAACSKINEALIALGKEKGV
jgi:bifunctional pyridoxal-dependent enzyme with beta-cystathionase and maltose regulon repressor activities